MRYILLLLLVHVLTTGKTQHTDSLTLQESFVKKLQALDIESFEKQHTDSFLRQLTIPYSIEVLPSSKLGYRYMALVRFAEHPYTEIQIHYLQLQYTNPNGMSRKKKARQVQQEKIGVINIYDNSLCIKGCS